MASNLKIDVWSYIGARPTLSASVEWMVPSTVAATRLVAAALRRQRLQQGTVRR